MRGDLRKRSVLGSAVALLALAVVMGLMITRYLEEQTAVAMKNARLYAQLREMSVLEEW